MRSARDRANASSGDATAIAVGRPWPTSFAKVGPDSTATGTAGPSTSWATWWGSLPVESSKPLLAQATRAFGPSSGLIRARTARSALDGTTSTTSSPCPRALSRSGSTASDGGNAAPGRYRTFSRSRATRSGSSSARPQRTVGPPPRANWIASAVPQEPAPSTTIGRIRARSVRLFGCRLAGLARRLFLQRALEQRIEVDVRQQERREAALDHDVRDGLADVGKQDVRRERAEDAACFVCAETAHQEYARLLHLGEVDGNVAGFRLDRHREDHFMSILADGVRHRA